MRALSASIILSSIILGSPLAVAQAQSADDGTLSTLKSPPDQAASDAGDLPPGVIPQPTIESPGVVAGVTIGDDDIVAGKRYTVNESELAAVDAVNERLFHREWVELTSGESAWVFVAR